MPDTPAEPSALRRAWAKESKGLPHLPEHVSSGGAFLMFSEPDRMLTFTWNGSFETPIDVEYAGNPVQWRFDYKDHKPAQIVAGTWSLVLAFEQACRNWIEAREDAR